jgi:hypothetical protein
MDASRIDALSRALAAGPSRRSVIAGLVGSVLSLASSSVDSKTRRSCRPPCGECERCHRGRCHTTRHGKHCTHGHCRPITDGTACSGGGTCQDGLCVCPGGLTRCDATCVDLTNDPRNCGSCGQRCQINGVCAAGACGCLNDPSCAANPGASCCPASTGGGCASCIAGLFNIPTVCGVSATCPPGLTPCLGPSCKACCPANSTCDPSTGTCLLQ